VGGQGIGRWRTRTRSPTAPQPASQCPRPPWRVRGCGHQAVPPSRQNESARLGPEAAQRSPWPGSPHSKQRTSEARPGESAGSLSRSGATLRVGGKRGVPPGCGNQGAGQGFHWGDRLPRVRWLSRLTRNAEEKEKETGKAPIAPAKFYSFTDAEANTREQIQKARSHPWISPDIPVRGFVYDVSTGRLSEVFP
jgi:hypothetical protein